MATVQSLVDQVLNEAALDATTAQALGWINERHKEMYGISRAALAGTASATFATGIPADAVVGDNTTTLVVDTDLLPGLVAGAIATGLRRTDNRPDLADANEVLFREAAEKMRQRVNQRFVTQTAESVQELLNEAVAAEGFEATQAQLLMWFNRRHREMVAHSREAEAGTAGFAATLPADVAAGAATSTLAVDPDCFNGLISGVIADGLIRHGKDPDLADRYETRFREAAERMRLRVAQRLVSQTADSVQALLSEAQAAEGFEASQAQLLLWLNRRHREMVAYAKGADAGTAAATFAATLPADVTAGSAMSALQVDPDCYNGLVAGVIADGLTHYGRDPALVDRFEARFREAAERMRVRYNQRVLTQTADSVQALLNEAVGAEGFDATQTQLLLWLNRRHKEMVAEARAYRDRISISTVADTAFYSVPDVVETYAVQVDGVPYSKARRNDLYAYSQGSFIWQGDGGFVIEDADATSAQGFTLLPTPTDVGTIEVQAAILPPTVTAADPASALKVDADCYDGLISGVIATGLLRHGHPDLAAPHEQVFQQTVQRLKTRVKRRYNTSGPAQIRVIGINA